MASSRGERDPMIYPLQYRTKTAEVNMSSTRNINLGVVCKSKHLVNSFFIASMLGILLFINGCVKMEATRKADWEDAFHGSPLCQPQTGDGLSGKAV